MDIFAPVEVLADFVTFDLLRLGSGSYLGSSINFFVYDSIKIGVLLLLINFVMAVTRYYFPMEKVRDILTKRRWFGLDYLFAALLGVITPFCSCSSIPLFIGFLGAGIPLGITFTFLISSPLVNEASLALFPAMFGPEITVLYNLVGIAVSIFGGLIISRMNMGKYVAPEFLKIKSGKEINGDIGHEKPDIKSLLKYWFTDGLRISCEVFPYVLLGVGIGALIHGFVPGDFALEFLSSRSWWAVPLAVILGIPLYANSVSVIPVVEALLGKGIPLGTALAFMTSIVTLSVPQALILKKVMKWQLLGMFFGITTLGIIFMGYLFNWLL